MPFLIQRKILDPLCLKIECAKVWGRFMLTEAAFITVNIILKQNLFL